MPNRGPTEADIVAALRTIREPGGRDLVAAGRLDGLDITADGHVQVTLRAENRADAQALEPVRAAAETAIAALPGVTRARVIPTAQRPAAASPPARPGSSAQPEPSVRPLPRVAHVVAIASAKGGVGKSTLTANLAVALAQRGLAVGLLDADIHGPSMPLMLGIDRQPEARDGLMQPIRAHGIAAMSIGFLVAPQTALVWRGPMVMGALTQLIEQVNWGALDILLVDLPPGTGDVPISLAQKAGLTGAVIVSTPQAVALADVRRGVAMFEKILVPILGVVENMSFFCCPQCGYRTDIFAHGGAEAEAAALGVPFLGAVPLLTDIRMAGDAGEPVVAADPNGAAAHAFAAIADTLAGRLASATRSTPPPAHVARGHG